MIDWNRFTEWTERYGHLWAVVVLYVAVAIVIAIAYWFLYVITLIVH